MPKTNVNTVVLVLVPLNLHTSVTRYLKCGFNSGAPPVMSTVSIEGLWKIVVNEGFSDCSVEDFGKPLLQKRKAAFHQLSGNQ